MSNANLSKSRSEKSSNGKSSNRETRSVSEQVSLINTSDSDANATKKIVENKISKDDKKNVDNKEGKDDKASKTREDSIKSESRELKSLREKCQKLREKNNDLELQLQDLKENKDNLGNNDSEKFNELNEKHQILLEENASLKEQLKEVSEEKVIHEKECIAQKLNDEHLDSEQETDVILEKVNTLVEDLDLKEALNKIIKKATITEKTYRYVLSEWNASKQTIKTLKDTTPTDTVENLEASVLKVTPANFEEKSDIKVNEDGKQFVNDNEGIINGNALLNATIARSDTVLKKISRKVTKDDMKSFVTDWSDKNINGVISMASLMLQEGQTFITDLEHKVTSSVQNSVRKERRMDIESVDTSKPPPAFQQFSPAVHTSVFSSGGSLRSAGPKQTFSSAKAWNKDNLEARGAPGDQNYKDVRSDMPRSGFQSYFRGRGRGQGYRSPSFITESGRSAEVRLNDRKTFTFTNEVRPDILEKPK